MAAAGGRGCGRRLELKEEAPKGLEEQRYSRTLDGVVVSQLKAMCVCVCVRVCVCVYDSRGIRDGGGGGMQKAGEGTGGGLLPLGAMH